ncbi:unnamed protein product, partial [Mesorhabditis spiculigera]
MSMPWPPAWGPGFLGEISSASTSKDHRLAAQVLSSLGGQMSQPFQQGNQPQKKNNSRPQAARADPCQINFGSMQMTPENMMAMVSQNMPNGGSMGNGHGRKDKGNDYHCPVQLCSKSFNSQDKLQRHLVIHSADRPHECQYCQRRFRRVDHLKKHERTHTGEKPFICDFCGRAFARSDKLYTHKKVHLTDVPTSLTNLNTMYPNIPASLVCVRPSSPG